MHLFDQRILGIMILFLLGALVVVKRMSTGSVLDGPRGNRLVQIVNSFNLFFLLIVNPLAAALLITRRLEMIDPTHINSQIPVLLTFAEIFGLMIYVLGYLLMAWALIRLGDNYQIGGSMPRTQDALVVNGPFRLIRHPMYTAAMSISLGLAGLTQSGALFAIFVTYLICILLLIPVEEDGLRRAYNKQYIFYQQNVKKLIPFVY